MKVSLNTVQRLIGFDLPEVSELVDTINRRLGGVEDTYELADKYRGALVVHVVTVEKHPNADRLRVCLVDDGGAARGVERNEDGLVQVVCGAPNVHDGMFAIWLPPNTTVPSTHATAEPFVLAKRELRGVVSNGMLAAADELAIGSDHEGIIELTERPSVSYRSTVSCCGTGFCRTVRSR